MPGYIKEMRGAKNDVSLVEEVNKKVINYSAPINSDSPKITSTLKTFKVRYLENEGIF